MTMAKALWDFMLLVWRTVTEILLFWYSKQTRRNHAMRTRALITVTEIVDSDLYICDGLCEGMHICRIEPHWFFYHIFWWRNVGKFTWKGRTLMRSIQATILALRNKPVIVMQRRMVGLQKLYSALRVNNQIWYWLVRKWWHIYHYVSDIRITLFYHCCTVWCRASGSRQRYVPSPAL